MALFRALPWFKVYCFLTSPVIFSLFYLILRWFFIDVVECYSFSNHIFVIDRKVDDDPDHFDSWLVHSEHALIHLSLNEGQINGAINTCLPVISPTKGEVYISECSINSTEWCNLITRHPELVYDGFSCIRTYSTFNMVFEGPRDPLDTLRDFLRIFCL
jgi:hypothetical protein